MFDLGDRNRPGGQEAEHNADATWDAAITVLPTSDASRTDAEQLSDAALCDAERAECRAELVRGRGALVSPPEVFSKAGRCSPPSRVVRLVEDRHHSVPDLESHLDQVASGPRCDQQMNRGAGPRFLETAGAEQGGGDVDALS